MVLYPPANALRQQAQQAAGVSTNSAQHMAGRREQDTLHQLTHTQQDLLLAALNSQTAGDIQPTYPPVAYPGLTKRSISDTAEPKMNANALYISPQNAELKYNGDYIPDLDYLDGDNYESDNHELDGDMIGALPGVESHEKRKNIDGDDSGEEGDAKRQEGEKGARKPGRKPLTSEPTTKRKAQNRAAQRAFRDRKEKHLKDLETKVVELTKESEADKKERALLQAELDRVKLELNNARKRLSLNGNANAIKGSPPLAAHTGQIRSDSGSTQSHGGALSQDNFQFDFPAFGALPNSQSFGNQQISAYGSNNGVIKNGNITPPVISQSPTTIGGFGQVSGALPAALSRANSSRERNMSSKPSSSVSRRNSPSETSLAMPSLSYSSTNTTPEYATTLPQMGMDNAFGGLFSPSLLQSASMDSNTFPNTTQQTGNYTQPLANANNGGDSTAGLNRVFQFNGGSSADSESPSNSLFSQWNVTGTNTSCGTSPESAHDSPANRTNSTGDNFSDRAVLQQNVPASKPGLLSEQSNGSHNGGVLDNTFNYSLPATDSTFDPVLFGDYRENQFNTFGGNDDFSNGFFDEALNYDFGSPSNLFGILQSPQQTQTSLNGSTGQNAVSNPSRNLMAEIEKTRDGGDDDYGLPTNTQIKDGGSGKMISCNNIWNQLQAIPDFQAGTFDLDSLCSELRAKARCEESGVMVDQEHVEAAFKKLGKKDETTGKWIPAEKPKGMPNLMFEQRSWDNVLKKLGQNGSQY